MAKKERKKYLNFEMITMDVKILKKELKKELKRKSIDQEYIEEILNYGAWGDEFPFIFSEIGHIDRIKSLLEEPNFNPNAQMPNGNTMLILALKFKHEGVALEILKHPSIDPNLKNRYGDTALVLASWNGYSQVVEELLKHPDINPNLKNRWYFYNTALHRASIRGHLQVVEALLKHPSTDPNVKSSGGDTALHLASNPWVSIDVHVHSQIIQAILDHPKTDISIKDKRGETAWDMAKPEIREQFPQLNPIANKFYKDTLILKSLLKRVEVKLPKGCKEVKEIKDLLS